MSTKSTGINHLDWINNHGNLEAYACGSSPVCEHPVKRAKYANTPEVVKELLDLANVFVDIADTFAIKLDVAVDHLKTSIPDANKSSVAQQEKHFAKTEVHLHTSNDINNSDPEHLQSLPAQNILALPAVSDAGNSADIKKMDLHLADEGCLVHSNKNGNDMVGHTTSTTNAISFVHRI